MDEADLLKLFFPRATKRLNEYKSGEFDLCHYTSVDSFYKIVDSKKFWMRNISLLNDSREVHEGWDLLDEFFRGEGECYVKKIRERFPNAAKIVFDGIVAAPREGMRRQVELSTYTISLSQIGKFDNNGRLSMWRGYGNGTSVALVVNENCFGSVNAPFNLKISHVEYNMCDNIYRNMGELCKNIVNFLSKNKNIEEEYLTKLLITVVSIAFVTIKHKGFMEEKEWRVVTEFPMGYFGHPLESIIINGNPQIVAAIPLTKYSNGYDISIDTLFKKILIGPTENPEIVRDSLRLKLIQAGACKLKDNIFITDIPYRG